MVIIEKENFSVSQICSSGQCFRLDLADETGKVYELTAGDRYLKIEVAEDQKKVRFYCTQEEFEQFWKTYFDLDTCYADYLSLIKDDEYLKRAAGFGSGIRILQQDLWVPGVERRQGVVLRRLPTATTRTKIKEGNAVIGAYDAGGDADLELARMG